MNICLFSGSTIKPHRGGIADYTFWAARALAARGHHVLCITTSTEACAPDVAGTLEVLEAHDPDLQERIAALLRLHRIELVWQQTLFPGQLALCRAVCDEVGAKLVCHLHVNPMNAPVGYTDCLAQDWYEFCHGRRLASFLLSLIRYIPGYIKRLGGERRRFRCLYDKADALILLSESLKSEFCRMAGLRSAEKLHALPNPLMLKPEPSASLPEKHKEVLYVGRLPWQHKRVDRLLKAWKMLESDFPDWHLTIVGEGAAQNCYQELCRELSLQHVVFEGKQNPQSYYDRARIFCMTSSVEGFGLVLIEAQAAGCVPVAFDSYAAVHDIIDDGVNGCLVKPFDIKAYAETLRGLMSNGDKLPAMAQAAQRSVARFSPELTLVRVEELFEQLVAQG